MFPPRNSGSFLLTFISLAFFSGGGHAVSPEDFHAILKARDAQVNNMTLRFTRTGTQTTTPPVWRLPRKERKYFPPAQPVILKYTSHERVTVRWPNVTFDRQTETTAEGENPGKMSFIPIQKWSNTDGQVREFVDDESKVKGGRTMEITKNEASLVPEQFMEVEFGFGFGFGKRIKKIALVTEDPKRFILEGEIQLWSADVSRFRLETDQNYVIRKAVVEADVDGNLTRYEVETEGAVEKDGVVFAKNGHVKRISQGMRKDGKIIGKPNVLDEFDLRFEEVRFNLPDVEYARLTNMDVPPDTMLFDRTTGERVYVDSEGRKQPLDQPNRPTGPSHNR